MGEAGTETGSRRGAALIETWNAGDAGYRLANVVLEARLLKASAPAAP